MARELRNYKNIGTIALRIEYLRRFARRKNQFFAVEVIEHMVLSV